MKNQRSLAGLVALFSKLNGKPFFRSTKRSSLKQDPQPKTISGDAPQRPPQEYRLKKTGQYTQKLLEDLAAQVNHLQILSSAVSDTFKQNPPPLAARPRIHNCLGKITSNCELFALLLRRYDIDSLMVDFAENLPLDDQSTEISKPLAKLGAVSPTVLIEVIQILSPITQSARLLSVHIDTIEQTPASYLRTASRQIVRCCDSCWKALSEFNELNVALIDQPTDHTN